jgi:hypothetical protein
MLHAAISDNEIKAPHHFDKEFIDSHSPHHLRRTRLYDVDDTTDKTEWKHEHSQQKRDQ